MQDGYGGQNLLLLIPKITGGKATDSQEKRFVRLQISEGIEPVSSLLFNANISSFVRLQISDGIEPVS